MPEFVDQPVDAMIGSGSQEDVRLLVGLHGDLDELGSEIYELDGEVLEKVGRTTLRVTIPKNKIDELCELPNILSVELDSYDVRPQTEEDFRRPKNSRM